MVCVGNSLLRTVSQFLHLTTFKNQNCWVVYIINMSTRILEDQRGAGEKVEMAALAWQSLLPGPGMRCTGNGS
jgi:hypothetical protein